jgi:S1-C subfamily serine protease
MAMQWGWKSVLLASTVIAGFAGVAGAAPRDFRAISAGEAFALLHGREARGGDVEAFGTEVAQSAPVPNFGRPPGGQSAPQPPSIFGNVPSSAPAVVSVPLTRREVVNRLRQNVVIVVAQNQRTRGWGAGTGFFINQQHLLTNTHVVEEADDVYLSNRTIQVRAGRVTFRGMARRAVGAGSQTVGIDTAIVEVLNFRASTFLPFAANVEEGETVAVAGFPGIALQFDKAYNDFVALLTNARIPTEDSIPSARFDFGTVFAIYNNRETSVENFQSGGFGAKGNSGSPLINACGQVVGQIYRGPQARLDVVQSGRDTVAIGETVNYNENLSFRALVRFIRASNIPFSQASDNCTGDLR